MTRLITAARILPFAFPNIAIAHEVIDQDTDFGRKFAADMEARTRLRVLGPVRLLLDSIESVQASTNGSLLRATTLADRRRLLRRGRTYSCARNSM